uniref:RING-type domain-containing protein n=1 Tax=Moniliophthora roreri TaxID=221103 RepID=A0A0W0FCF6_MONRR
MSNLGTIAESGPSSARSSPEHFSYPGAQEPQLDNDSDEEFVYPGAPNTDNVHPQEEAPPAPSLKLRPSPAQLESLYAAASSGDLPLLQKLFRTALGAGNVESFSLANDASTRTGYTALHAAANKGHLDIIKWLIEDCGSMPDLEDKEGETALHKAALNGYLHIIKYLLPDRADIHARDVDGWTALHNACSKGYLDIVRWLCEVGGAATEVNGVRGVDIRSKGGWTPLMNAASKGHLPVVLYLLTAGVFEVWICEILQKAEAERWNGSNVSYNPLSVHTTVPLILYENQRLDTRIKTLAVSGGRPKFSASGLGKQGRRAPFEVRLLNSTNGSNGNLVPAWRSDVQLPLRESPWTLPTPGSTHLEGCERSHFWLSDWTLDVTYPNVDVEEGWQYAHRFSDSEDQWSAEMPPQLQRIISGGVSLSPSLSGPSSPRRSSLSNQPTTWVRRRRWVRVMRRRLDIPPLPFLLPDGGMYHVDGEGKLVPYSQNEQDVSSHEEGQEMGAMSSNFFSSAQDYVGRARYLVGTQSDWNNTTTSAVEARRAIAKLERATAELRQGILADDDIERKTQAEVLLNAYSRELERRRLAAGAQGLLISGNDDEQEDDADDSDEEFHYPGSSSRDSIRPASRASSSTDYFARPNVSRQPTDLTPQLSQAPDFRVPTHEAPQKVARWTQPNPHQIHHWERDEDVIPSRLQGMRATSMERVFIDQERLTIPSHGESSSQLSDLAECPVCNRNLDQLGGATEQEAHVKNCLEGGSGTAPQSAKYLVYKLPAESALIGIECEYLPRYLRTLLFMFIVSLGVICLEEFVKGSMVARLSCFCSFHNTCLSSWLQRGKSCPVHAR